MENVQWYEQQVQQLEQQLRDRDSVSAQNAFAQPLNEAAISNLSDQEVSKLFRLIASRVGSVLSQESRPQPVDTTTDDETHEVDSEAPPSKFGTIRKGKGKKLFDGFKKGLTRSGTLKGKESRRSSIGDTFSRVKSFSKSTLGLDKSGDDTAATEESSTASPVKPSTLEPPTTPTNRPSTDTRTSRFRRKLSTKALKNVGPVEGRDAEEDGSTTETSLTDATAGASPTPAKQRQMLPLQKPLIDTMAHPRRDAGLARVSQDALSLPPNSRQGSAATTEPLCPGIASRWKSPAAT